jgi:hypothetical protein
MGEKIMKITIVGGILIVAAVIAVLIILDASAENPSFTKLLSNICKPIRTNDLPGTGPFTKPISRWTRNPIRRRSAKN